MNDDSTPEPKYTADELVETLKVLDSGVLPTDESPVDDAVGFLQTTATTIDAVYGDGVFGPGDFDALKPFWESAWLLADKADELEADVKSMGLVKKVTTAIRTIQALVAIFKAMKRAKTARKAVMTTAVSVVHKA